MRKIDKSTSNIVSKKYLSWIKKIDIKGENHDKTYRYYYDDIVMNLYKCQSGVCAYTEMFICIPELYKDENWLKGRYRIPDAAEYSRLDHLGEMDHFEANDKGMYYWNWDNLFMIHAKVNSIKSDAPVAAYLKPDLDDYAPEKYFDYDNITHRFIPNTDIEDENITLEIQQMIDHVLCLNHGVVRNERRDYINVLKDKMKGGENINVDRFFTAVNWTIF